MWTLVNVSLVRRLPHIFDNQSLFLRASLISFSGEGLCL